jgi:DNA-binding CsgD family transcriptional regulator
VTPTVRQVECLRAYLRFRSQSEAAASLGIAYRTLRAHLRFLAERLGTHSAIESATALGWLQLPTDEEIAAWQAADRAEAVLGQLRSAGPASGGVRVPVRDPATTRPGAPECRCHRDLPGRMSGAHRMDCPRAA